VPAAAAQAVGGPRLSRQMGMPADSS
jgi:hypothetical protein